MSHERRRVIVNADDFGRCEHTTAGIARAFDEGIVRSASLMVRGACAQDAAAVATERPAISVGLHLDLGEWRRRPDGHWEAVYLRVDPADAAAVDREAREQLALFRGLLGRDPTHLDSHQHAHREGPARDVARAIARELGLPLRASGRGVAYCGAFYGRDEADRPTPEAVTTERLVGLLSSLPAGTTELCCHPGTAGCDDPSYGAERALELETLCDPRARVTLSRMGVELTTFHELFEDGERRDRR